MRIILATPALLPETGASATYTAGLAERLKVTHEVTVVSYGQSPAQISGVKIITVPADGGPLSRFAAYFFALLRIAKKADIIYVQNATTVGLAAAFVGMWLAKPVVLKFAADAAWEKAVEMELTKKTLDEFLARPPSNFKIGLLIDLQKFVLSHVSKITPPSDSLRTLVTTYYGVDAQKVQVNEETEWEQHLEKLLAIFILLKQS